MSRKLLAVFIAIFLAEPVLGSDPWKDKDYTQWTMEDVQRILTDSPWVRTDNVDAEWLKGAPHYLQPLAESCGGRPDLTKQMHPPPQWEMGNPTQSVVAFQVEWQSAWTIRAAHIRLAVLCGRMENDQGEDALEKEPSQYVISLAAADMTPFDGATEETLLKNTSLTLKGTKRKLVPEKVVIGHGYDRRSVYRLTFAFSRKTDSGEPTITPDEKELEFVSQAGKTTVKVRFQPPKMVRKTGVDL